MTLYASALYIVARNLKFEFLYNWAIESVLIGFTPDFESVSLHQFLCAGKLFLCESHLFEISSSCKFLSFLVR